ncbi:MAG: hypothetical protein K0R65_2289 [Crocinitomicaceae bacterium]|jgi:hypothetical protein|nr:hypothetical protein [Crocinitomicaceae bacterium]
MKFFLVFISSILTCSVSFSQRQNARSKSELGAFVGGAYYIGDLNELNHFQNTNLAYGGIFRFNVHSRMSLRANFSYGNLEASDQDATNPVMANRNLSFKTDFYEFGAGVEFNYLPYQTGHSRHRISPYVFVELGLFRINPKTEYNGEWYELQPLGTEGQGTDLSKEGFYSRTQLCVPAGLGLKVSIARNLAINIEFGVRKTFTDYIDDVHSSRYIDRESLSEINGPLVADLSNRSLDQSPYGRRGNPATKDWYFVFGGMLTYRLGPPDKCFNH